MIYSIICSSFFQGSFEISLFFFFIPYFFFFFVVGLSSVALLDSILTLSGKFGGAPLGGGGSELFPALFLLGSSILLTLSSIF